MSYRHPRPPTATACHESRRVYPILLLLGSNRFMTSLVRAPEVQVGAADPGDLVSWGIAFFEYCLMVPANRMGSAVYSAPQLKGMQEVITRWCSPDSRPGTWRAAEWNHWAGFG